MSAHRSTLFAAILLSLLSACGGGGGGGTDAGTPMGTYAEVAPILMTSCAFASCHGGAGRGAGNLNFQSAMAAGMPLTTVLNDVTSCQYSAMPLVDPGDPDNSWLWIKLTAMHGAGGRIEFTPDPSWDPGIEPDATGRYPSSICPLTSGGDIVFGVLMPQGTTTGLSPERLAIIRAWIENGAPGPT